MVDSNHPDDESGDGVGDGCTQNGAKNICFN